MLLCYTFAQIVEVAHRKIVGEETALAVLQVSVPMPRAILLDLDTAPDDP